MFGKTQSLAISTFLNSRVQMFIPLKVDLVSLFITTKSWSFDMNAVRLCSVAKENNLNLSWMFSDIFCNYFQLVCYGVINPNLPHCWQILAGTSRTTIRLLTKSIVKVVVPLVFKPLHKGQFFMVFSLL